MSEYEQKANNFLKRSNTEIKIEFGGCTINQDWKEKEPRNFYNVTLKNCRGEYNFVFWDSLNNTRKYNDKKKPQTLSEFYRQKLEKKGRVIPPYTIGIHKRLFVEIKNEYENECFPKPNAYDILACLCKSDPSYFEQFCQEYGYDDDSRTAEKIYLACVKEYKLLERMFTTEQMEELCEIQ